MSAILCMSWLAFASSNLPFCDQTQASRVKWVESALRPERSVSMTGVAASVHRLQHACSGHLNWFYLFICETKNQDRFRFLLWKREHHAIWSLLVKLESSLRREHHGHLTTCVGSGPSQSYSSTRNFSATRSAPLHGGWRCFMGSYIERIVIHARRG